MGTVCVTAAGLEFETTEEGTISQGGTECTVAARCLTPGKIGNAPAGMVSYMTVAPVGVASCRNEAAFTGGADAESDEDLRKRVTSSFRRLPNGANAAYYEQAALSVEGVRAAAVTPRANGRGTVKVTVASESGVPSAALLSAVEDTINEMREICVDLTVAAPSAVTVNVAAKVDAEEGYDGATVRNDVAAAVTAFFDGGLLGKSVTRAMLGSIIYGVEGVKTYTLTSPASDVSASETALPVLGTLSVTAWS
ncbi:MAG: baseplate J/gp47 family protein [Oscillospiraceae bacterium]|nr:baseplate J/gp47 family protein [Oscillospiraceae bacterium]